MCVCVSLKMGRPGHNDVCGVSSAMCGCKGGCARVCVCVCVFVFVCSQDRVNAKYACAGDTSLYSCVAVCQYV